MNITHNLLSTSGEINDLNRKHGIVRTIWETCIEIPWGKPPENKFH